MGYITIQEAREELNAMMDDAKLCPSCFWVLKERDGDDDEPNYLMCSNGLCLDITRYPLTETKTPS